MLLHLSLALLAATAAPLLDQGRDSPEPATAPDKQPLNKTETAAIVTKLATALEENFVFPDVGKRYAAMLRAKLASGQYDDLESPREFAITVTADLQSVAPDGHLELLSPDKAASRAAAPISGRTPESAIDKSGWVAEGVAYISFRDLPGDNPTMAHLRAFLAEHVNAHSLIVDLRENRGGGIDEMDLLFPQLFAKPTDLLVMDTRPAFEKKYGSPWGEVTSLRHVAGPEGVFRQVHFTVPAPTSGGLRNAKVFVLTSKRTVSAGEHFSLALKRTGRATLIGETTRGAGHYGYMERLPGGYAAFIPVGRTFDPETGEGWEGTGVKPDIETPADKALHKALELAAAERCSYRATARNCGQAPLLKRRDR